MSTILMSSPYQVCNGTSAPTLPRPVKAAPSGSVFISAPCSSIRCSSLPAMRGPWLLPSTCLLIYRAWPSSSGSRGVQGTEVGVLSYRNIWTPRLARRCRTPSAPASSFDRSTRRWRSFAERVARAINPTAVADSLTKRHWPGLSETEALASKVPAVNSRCPAS